MNNLEALKKINSGWSESRPGGLLCNPDISGGIIDCTHGTNEWFIIFNDDRPIIEGFESRDDAIEAFIAARMANID